MQQMTKFTTSFTILFMIITTQAQIVDVAAYEGSDIGVSPFKNGFAKIVDHGTPYYINTKGEQLELEETNSFNFRDEYAISEYEKEIRDHPDYLPKTIVHYHNENVHGILSPKGEILLEAEYDFIDAQFRTFWKIGKDGKTSVFLPDKTLLPFFDEIGYLNGEYFDVKDDGKWHLYNKSQKRIITKDQYDGFDYCGGCGSSSPYVYARKDGKWGIIDWNENILLPFEYEHSHCGMRSDNWVNSFSKDGRKLVVNIASKQEFYEGELLMGLLIASKDEQFGAYGQDGILKIPFEYDKIELPNANSYQGYYGKYLITTKHNKKGVLDLEGIEILPTEYNDIKIYDDYFVVKKNKISYLLDITQEVLTAVEHGEITHVDDYFYSSGSKGVEVFKIKKRAYYGLFFAKRRVEVTPEFYKIDYIGLQSTASTKRYLIAEKNGTLKVFDDEGSILLENCQKISDIFNTPEGFVSVKKNGKTGIYDLKSQKEILPPLYDNYDIWSLDNQRIIKANVSERPDDPFSAAYLKHHLYGMNGKQLVDWDLEKVDSLSKDRLLLKIKGEGMGYILFDTRSLKTEKLNYAGIYKINSRDLLVVSNDNITGRLYDIELKKELDGDYDLQRLKLGYISQNPKDHPVIFPFKNGMALVYDERGYGYINEKGKSVIQPQYDQAFDFIGEVAMVGMFNTEFRNHYSFMVGFIGKNGKLIFPLEYDVDNTSLSHDDFYFTGNAVKLSQWKDHQHVYGLGDLATGKQLLPMKYTQIRKINNGPYLLLQKGRKLGITDTQGNIVIPVEYEDIVLQTDSYNTAKLEDSIFPLLVYKDGKWRYINMDGTYLPVVGDYTNR